MNFKKTIQNIVDTHNCNPIPEQYKIYCKFSKEIDNVSVHYAFLFGKMNSNKRHRVSFSILREIDNNMSEKKIFLRSFYQQCLYKLLRESIFDKANEDN